MDVSALTDGTSLARSLDARRTQVPAGAASDRHEAIRGGYGERARGGLALGVLRQELRGAVIAHFRGYVQAAQPSYVAAPVSAGEVAEETLDAAKQASAASPTTAARSLISFRMQVRETASYVRQLVGPGNAAEVDDAVARIDDGLDTLGREVAANRESSASVLQVESRRKERTTIRIRTQDGDVVKLKLKNVEKFSAEQATMSDEEGYSELTSIRSRSRSGLMLKVDGELDEGELEAIRNVLAHAEDIATEFFDGDLAAAFELAQGFSFDSSELARVKMRFGLKEVTRLRYAEARTDAGTPPAEDSADRDAVLPDAATPVTAAPVAATVSDIESVAVPAATPDQAPVLADSESGGPDSSEQQLENVIAGFLRTLREGFFTADEVGPTRLHFSERFKLDLLQAVVRTIGEAAGED